MRRTSLCGRKDPPHLALPGWGRPLYGKTSESRAGRNKKNGPRKDRKGGKKRARYQTADLFYAAMASYGIPFECEKWHLNRLLALIRACGEENLPPEKMGKREQAAHIRALNAQRRAKMHSRG